MSPVDATDLNQIIVTANCDNYLLLLYKVELMMKRKYNQFKAYFTVMLGHLVKLNMQKLCGYCETQSDTTNFSHNA